MGDKNKNTKDISDYIIPTIGGGIGLEQGIDIGYDMGPLLLEKPEDAVISVLYILGCGAIGLFGGTEIGIALNKVVKKLKGDK